MGCVTGLKADKADAPHQLVYTAVCALLCASSRGKTLPGTTRVIQDSVPAPRLRLLPWSWAGLLCFVLAGRESSAAPESELSSATAFQLRKPPCNLQRGSNITFAAPEMFLEQILLETGYIAECIKSISLSSVQELKSGLFVAVFLLHLSFSWL